MKVDTVVIIKCQDSSFDHGIDRFTFKGMGPYKKINLRDRWKILDNKDT